VLALTLVWKESRELGESPTVQPCYHMAISHADLMNKVFIYYVTNHRT